MPLAFLLALLLCIALGVYALRVAGERNRLQREVDIWRDSACGFTIVYGNAGWLAQDSARQRQLRAAKVLDGARKARRRK